MSENHPLPSSASAELLNRLANGDADAATDIFERYVERLTRLARSRLATKLASRFDPEDIVLSAYRSFFVAAQQGRFELHRGGDLWRLLVEVTLHKLYRRADHHLARRRSIEREGGSTAADLALAGREPTPEEAAAAADELEATLKQLSEEGRKIIELRLEGYEHEEIAARLGCSERTVRRRLNEARRLLASRGGKNFVPSAARTPPRRKREPPEFSLQSLAIDAPLVWNEYVLQEQIGAGAMGRVYRVLHTRSNSELAVKFLRKALLESSVAVRRFLNEAQTVADLAHSGIVAVQGAGRTPGGGLFLVMELVDGTDLDRLHRDGCVSTEEALRWTCEAAEIVNFANERGVIHCDLKPSNILLGKDGRLRVTDFGLAVRLSESLTETPPLAGTPGFMAPEQVDTCWGQVSPRTDVWGLGAVLYFLLFGKPPNAGGDVATVLANIVSKTPVPLPENAKTKIPASVLQTLRRCLAKSPEDRFESAGLLSAALFSAAFTA